MRKGNLPVAITAYVEGPFSWVLIRSHCAHTSSISNGYGTTDTFLDTGLRPLDHPAMADPDGEAAPDSVRGGDVGPEFLVRIASDPERLGHLPAQGDHLGVQFGLGSRQVSR